MDNIQGLMSYFIKSTRHSDVYEAKKNSMLLNEMLKLIDERS